MDTFEYFLFQGNLKPHFDERNKCFELDSCLGFAKVCLVYKDIASGIITRSDRLISIIFRRFVKPRVSRVILQMCFLLLFLQLALQIPLLRSGCWIVRCGGPTSRRHFKIIFAC